MAAIRRPAPGYGAIARGWLLALAVALTAVLAVEVWLIVQGLTG